MRFWKKCAAAAVLVLCVSLTAKGPRQVATLLGNGAPGFSDSQVNNPYGLVIGPDGALYFCDIDNHRVRRLDLKTRRVTTVAGSGEKGYSGDGGPALQAKLNQPYEVRFDGKGDLYFVEMPNHVVRKVDKKTGLIQTVAGTGEAGFSGDGGPAGKAQLRQPHSIAFDPQGRLLICDIGNHRIRRVDLGTRVIDTYAGTGDKQPTPDGAAVAGTPINGPRAMDFDRDGNLYLVLREGNAVYRIDAKTQRYQRIAGTGAKGYSGDGGRATEALLNGPKGISYASPGLLYLADTENHVIRMVDLKTMLIRTVLGNGQRGDGPEPDPSQCKLNRPHGVFAADEEHVYVGDSESHRVRLLQEMIR